MEDKNKIYSLIATKGEASSNEEIEKEIDKILEAIPESLTGMYPEERYARALAYSSVYYKKQDEDEKKPVNIQNGGTPGKASNGSKAKAKKYSIAIDIAPEAENIIAKYTSDAEMARKIANGKATTVEKVLYMKQSSKDLHDAGYLKDSYVSTADPKAIREKYEAGVKAYEAQTGDKENTARFEAYVAKVQNQEEIPVKYSDSYGGFQGVILSTPGAGKAKKEVKAYNKAEAIEFLIYDSVFVVEVNPNTLLGLKATAMLKPKENTTADSAVTTDNYTPVIVLKVEGQKEARKNTPESAARREFIKEIAMKEDGKTPELGSGLVTVADEYCFKYIKKDAEEIPGTKLKKETLVRPKISITTMPKFVLKTGAPYEFEKHFVDTSNTFKLPATDAEKKAATEQMRLVYAGVIVGNLKPGASGFTGNMAQLIKEADEAASKITDADKEAIASAMK